MTDAPSRLFSSVPLCFLHPRNPAAKYERHRRAVGLRALHRRPQAPHAGCAKGRQAQPCGHGVHRNLEKLFLEPIKKIEGTVTLPGSKSMSNRILLLAALAEGKTKVLNLLDSDDIRFMVDALKQLGLEITEDRENNVLEIEGLRGQVCRRGHRAVPRKCGHCDEAP